jgi:leader peptidase (prepilin peptidase)/N-methyltransferase
VTIEPWMAFIFGLLIGSFLNVCIYRLPRELSVLHPARSFCPTCERQIAFYDNIPVLSYLLLRGRCRHCGTHIPMRYAATELFTGLLFAAVAYMGLPTIYTVKLLVFMAILVTLIFTDLEERFLPDAFTLGGTVVGLLFAWLAPLQQGAFLFFLHHRLGERGSSLVEAAVASLLLSGLLYLLGEAYYWIRKREGLGLGDVKMVAMLGAFLGLQGALLSLAIASLLGCVLGLSYILWNRKDFATYQLPLGTFLGVAGIGLTFYLLPVIAPQ